MATIGIYSSSVSASWDPLDRLIALDANEGVVCQIVGSDLFVLNYYDIAANGLGDWTLIDAAANSGDYTFYARDVDWSLRKLLNNYSIAFTYQQTLAGQVRFVDPIVGNGGGSYANYDAGWLGNNGYFNRIHPGDASIVQQLDWEQVNGPAWRTVVYPNRWGTYERYTLDDGTTAPYNIYTPYSRVYQDHYTGMETVYFDDTARTWAASLRDPSSDGFFLGTEGHYSAWGVVINSYPLISSPARPNVDYWTSTTIMANNTNALQYYNRTTLAQQLVSLSKTASRRQVYFRYMDYEVT